MNHLDITLRLSNHDTPNYRNKPRYYSDIATKKGLRRQLHEIVTRWVNKSYLEAAGLPRAIEALASKAFLEQVPENRDTRAIRRGLQLLGTSSYLTDEEPEVE